MNKNSSVPKKCVEFLGRERVSILWNLGTGPFFSVLEMREIGHTKHLSYSVKQ